MSSFGAKRKARIIKIDDEGDVADNAPSSSSGEGTKDGKFSNDPTRFFADEDTRLTCRKTEPSNPKFNSKSGRKPFRQSGLRKSFNPADNVSIGADFTKDEDDEDGPVVVRPAISRSRSLKQKKRSNKSSRLSFGGDEGSTGDDEDSGLMTPKKVPLGQRALENSAIKRGISTRGLPLRSFGDDDDRPRYSKEYLNELQSSTPNTPQKISTYPPDEEDAMDLDASELEGALIVDAPDLRPPKASTTILTEAEIQEKKERRARLAKEQGFLSVEDDDEDGFGRKKKDDTRLIAEDEDLGEGFDNYVEDGGLSLGKRAEKERRKHERQKMAELITAAEGHTSDSSSDSDAERRIAYEAAQTRAGMDGLKKLKKKPQEDLLQVPPKITPLPSLTECLSRLQATLKGMEDDLKLKQARVEKLKTEREEILVREKEVQSLLDETGKKYQEAMGQGKVENGATPRTGLVAEVLGERGLENLGTTPVRKDEEGDVVL